MYESGLDLSQNIQNQQLRLLITAEAMIYYYKVGNAGAARALVEFTQSGLDWAKDPEVLCMTHLALAYNAAAARNWSVFDAETQAALTAADESGLVQRQGDCYLGKAEGLLAHEKMNETVDASKKALQCYTLAHDYLSQSETHILLSRYYHAVRNPDMGETENRAALDVLDDLSNAPMVDPEKIFGMVPQLLVNHLESARRGDFGKARNQILTLLILKKHQAQLKNKDQAVESLGIRESELLAYLANYVLKLGAPLAGRVLLSFSEQTAENDLNPVVRSRQRWLAGRFWRQAGYAPTALDLFDKATQVLARLDNPDPALDVGLAEDRALALLQMGQKEEAVSSLNRGLAQAKNANLADDAARLQRYLDAIAAGKSNIEEQATVAEGQGEEKRVSVRRRVATSGPDVFQSPFAADYSGSAGRSAAAAVRKVQMARLDPTPTPLDLSPELLIRSQLYDQAAAKLVKILKAEGDSVDRLMQLGTCYFDLCQWEKAQDAFQRVLKLDPKNGPAKEYLSAATRSLENKPRLVPETPY
jgi:tetratricopeptide (TPR) repeat protein